MNGVYRDGARWSAPHGCDPMRMEFDRWAEQKQVTPESLEWAWQAWLEACADRLHPFIISAGGSGKSLLPIKPLGLFFAG